MDMRALLDWYADAGVTTAEAAGPANLYDWPEGGHRMAKPGAVFRAPPPRPDPSAKSPAAPTPAAPAPVPGADQVMPTDEAVALARQLAAGASTLAALIEAISGFDGCPLKAGARNTVVYDGVQGAPILVVGEAPGKEEDREGKPFIGRAGMLLDKMLGAIGHSRSQGDGLGDVCITNSIYWRPPGNRAPTKAEIEICLPLVERFIALSAPKLIILTGNVPTQALFPGIPGITRTRGTWREWANADAGHQGAAIPVLPIFHPAFLLRQPGQKRLAWSDLLAVRARLEGASA